MNKLDFVGARVVIKAYRAMPDWLSRFVGTEGQIKSASTYANGNTWFLVEITDTAGELGRISIPAIGLRLRVRAGSRQITAWECFRDHAYNSAHGPMPDQIAAAAKRDDFWRHASRVLNRRVPKFAATYAL